MQSIFGTDGIRGIFNREITYDLAQKIGYAFGITNNNSQKVLIGRDTRVSGEVLLEALSNGLNQSGKEVIDIGICPTPAIPYLIKKFWEFVYRSRNSIHKWQANLFRILR